MAAFGIEDDRRAVQELPRLGCHLHQQWHAARARQHRHVAGDAPAEQRRSPIFAPVQLEEPRRRQVLVQASAAALPWVIASNAGSVNLVSFRNSSWNSRISHAMRSLAVNSPSRSRLAQAIARSSWLREIFGS